MNAAVAAYRDVRRASLVEGKTPHQLTLMLFDGALERIATARELVAPEERAMRRHALDRALGIVHELQGALRDPETNTLSAQLFALYAHAAERLLEASRSNADEPLALASDVLGMLRDGWAEIAPNGQP